MQNVIYAASAYGYCVQVIEGSEVAYEYTAGNHQGESQTYVDPGSPNAVPLRQLRRWARQTAGEIAEDRGISRRANRIRPRSRSPTRTVRNGSIMRTDLGSRIFAVSHNGAVMVSTVNSPVRTKDADNGKTPVHPEAVFIPMKHGKEGRDFDRTDCTLLMGDGEYAYGKAYTEEAWLNGGEPSYVQRRGEFYLTDDTGDSDWAGATAARCLCRQNTGPGLLDRRHSSNDEANLRRLRTGSSPTFPSLRDVALTSFTLSSINMNRPTTWTRTRTSGMNCTNSSWKAGSTNSR